MGSIRSASRDEADRRHPARRPWTVAIAAAALSLLAAPLGVLAQDETGEAFCELLTAREIKAAVGSKVDPLPGWGSCDWWASGSRGEITSLNVSWNDVAQEDWDLLFPSLESLTVGGSSAWYWADEYSAALLIEVAPGVLLLNAGLAEGGDARAGLVQLGELAIERAASLPAPPDLPEAASEEPADDGATDAMAAAFCSVFSAEEVAAAVGGEVADGSPTVATEGGCEWVGGDLDDFVYVSVNWDPGTLADLQQLEGESITVGGRPAWFTAEMGPGLLYVELDQGLLGLSAEPAEDVDPKAALTTLGEMVVSRSGSLVAPPAPAPEPAGADGLEALFPESVGGQALTVDSMIGPDALSPFSNAAAISDVISAGGGDPNDVALAVAFTADPPSTIFAVQLDGVDAAALLPVMLEAGPGAGSETEVAGKGVTKVAVEGSAPMHLYAKDDILWMVQAKEAIAEEILAALP